MLKLDPRATLQARRIFYFIESTISETSRRGRPTRQSGTSRHSRPVDALPIKTASRQPRLESNRKNTASTRAEEQVSVPFEGVGRPDAIAVLYLDVVAEESVAMSEFFTYFVYRTLIPLLHLLPID